MVLNSVPASTISVALASSSRSLSGAKYLRQGASLKSRSHRSASECEGRQIYSLPFAPLEGIESVGADSIV